MKKTKVVCTMGPNTNDRELLKKLIENGMDVARFNFSHGDHEEQKSRMDLLKELRQELNTNTAILLDTRDRRPYESIERRKKNNAQGRRAVYSDNRGDRRG